MENQVFECNQKENNIVVENACLILWDTIMFLYLSFRTAEYTNLSPHSNHQEGSREKQ